MKLVLYALMLIIILNLNCTSRKPSIEDIQRLANGGEKNLPELYKIAATIEGGFDLNGPGRKAVLAISSMGSSGTPYLIDLLAVPGAAGPQHTAFSEIIRLVRNASPHKDKEHRTFLALLYSVLTAPPDWQSTDRLNFFRLSLHRFEGIDKDSSLSDICLWWLRSSEKFPQQILPEKWPKSVVLKRLINEIQKDPNLSKESKELIDKISTDLW